MDQTLEELTGDALLRQLILESRETRDELRKVNEKFDRIHNRLEEGRVWMRQCEADLTVCVRAVQINLLEKATKMQVVKSLSEVSAVLERLEDADTEPPGPIPDEVKTNPGVKLQ
jgi:uncharacterized coiled-coil DUF342 family protein